MKICSKCGVEKHFIEYSKNARRKDGLESHCRECKKAGRTLITVCCVTCNEEAERRQDQIKIKAWECSSCVQSRITNLPKRRLQKSIASREQVLRQGGIPWAGGHPENRRVGPLNNKWKGGITSEQQKERGSPEAVRWKKLILIRDGFTCQLCGQLGGKLNVHHKKQWAIFKELRYELDNGITLCIDCHKNKAHSGSWHNVPIDWEILKQNEKTL